ncbi:hypothetical protein HZH68_011419 [Vespula germanica]|uniref:Uncharacterized protein n=1 Tax=Vespula germanica TaxID=30212 RepID=A0A834JUQ2_VESGE|nr:hypothetical protein HZH68_011419 [Vespula germanica]
MDEKRQNIPAGWVMRVNVKKINSYSSANASTRMNKNLRSPHQEKELPEREIPRQQDFEQLEENVQLATERKNEAIRNSPRASQLPSKTLAPIFVYSNTGEEEEIQIRQSF